MIIYDLHLLYMRYLMNSALKIEAASVTLKPAKKGNIFMSSGLRS
jgi:hypothetical protein